MIAHPAAPARADRLVLHDRSGRPIGVIADGMPSPAFGRGAPALFLRRDASGSIADHQLEPKPRLRNEDIIR